MKDYAILDQIRYLLIDMDGVLWRGSTPMPGLSDFFDLLRRAQVRFMLATNNSSKTVDHYVKQLEGYGVRVSPDQIITSGLATAGYLAEHSEPGTPVYVIGEEGLRQALRQAGFRLVDTGDSPRYVVGSWDRQLTYDKLAEATLFIRAGATFIGTNPDKTWPNERGLLPGAGAVLAALEAASGVAPRIIGKPSPELFRQAMRRIGATQDETAMLGDRLDTDILGAQNAGLATILVLSGVTKEDQLAASPFQPDVVFEDIAALTRVWQERLAGRVVDPSPHRSA